ncbi:dipicolinate synthase subunit DpsA [Acetivibrio ethanolgignens]|uniref:Dipicolinate synthase subunit A N-terminal domain-containing protein n=1 Tax=Acetivibrio ethanolgignens TaxID=290052 RepID=A0A0V8QBK9_9FIRM|nr:dipicolinate synthase subunit DpsA [Acetivibrio ethanolgignens]KSV57981.1 hypothetical protein ASU35_14495 [Acetivibrio ethanolgignens]
MYDISVIGGDIRQIYMIKRLLSCHLSVIAYGLSHPLIEGAVSQGSTMAAAIQSSPVIISAIPFSSDGCMIPALTSSSDMSISCFLDSVQSGQTVFAGMFSKDIKEALTQKRVCFYDFMTNDGVAILNGIATAEGAIMKAIESGSGNLHGSQVLVTGFGRCGKVLAKKLSGLDCCVTVAARQDCDRCLSRALGYDSISFEELPHRVSDFNYIFNTVPVLIFDSSLLKRISPEAVLIDIASRPGGFDFKTAKNLSLNLHHFLGIPGKVAPKASGDILVDFIFQTNTLRKKV